MATVDPTAPGQAYLTTPLPFGADPLAALRRALRLLEAASPDSRAAGPTDGSFPLHWPCAVAAAQAHVEHALRLLECYPAEHD